MLTWPIPGTTTGAVLCVHAVLYQCDALICASPCHTRCPPRPQRDRHRAWSGQHSLQGVSASARAIGCRVSLERHGTSEIAPFAQSIFARYTSKL